jgi:signal transduction histidine kinase
MSGLGFQLEVCKAEAESPTALGPPAQLAFARRMLDHAVDELRNSVWTLRSLPLDGMSLPEALELIAKRMGEGRQTQIEVLADPILARVPDFIAGNLLLVAQEALHNALKHAAPRHVTLEVHTYDHPARVSLTVHDDGCGFSPGTQLTPADGHFGLLGMRERIDRFAGTIQIRSAPGQGTVIHAVVPLHAYDDELADRPIDSPLAEA